MSAESPAAAAAAAAANSAAPAQNANAAANASGVSVWDFILLGQQPELQAYVNMMQERDDLTTDEKDVVMPKILDARVESSIRFNFENPLVGQHGYFHVMAAKSPNKFAKEVLLKGSTPLHYAVQLRLPEIVQVLLQAGSDPSLMDEKNQTAYLMARTINDARIIAVFQQHRLFAHRQRKQTRALATECETARKHLAQFQHDTRVLTTVRQTLMAQVVALWWRYTTSIVRRQAIASQKQALATQLENLVKVSTETVQNLERDKQALSDERQALADQVAALQQQTAHLEAQLADARAKLAERDGELQDRNALRAEIQKLQQALKGSLELITAQQNAVLAQASASAATSSTVDASAFTLLQQQAQSQQAELAKLRADLAAAQQQGERARGSEVALRAEVDALQRTAAQLRTDLATANAHAASSASSLSAASVSDISTAQVQQHAEYKRLEALYANSQHENERLRQSEQQLRQQLAQALGQA